MSLDDEDAPFSVATVLCAVCGVGFGVWQKSFGAALWMGVMLYYIGGLLYRISKR